jgi:hypothetical protein
MLLMNSSANKTISASVVLLEVSVASAEWEEAWEAACTISLEAVLEDLAEEWVEDSLPCRPSPQAWATLLVLHLSNLKLS